MSDRFYTSDLHFGHMKLVEKGFRPFASTQEMDQALIQFWNETVKSDDEVWILGDLAMRPLDTSLAAARKLNGRKILVPGNHDECWLGQRGKLPSETAGPEEMRYRLARQMQYRWAAGIAEIVDSPAVHHIAGENVELSHFPFTADHTDTIRHPEWRPEDNGGWLLHGHLHEMWQQHDKQINVGVDAWGLRPVHFDTIAELIAAGPADRTAAPMLV